MDKKQINSLTSYEITFTLVGTVVGVYLLKAAGDVTIISRQDGWMSMLIGALYPLYIVIIASYIIKNHPKDNILALSKKYLGAILGNTLNFIFLLQFALYLTFMGSSIVNLLKTYEITPISFEKIVFLIFTIAAYTTSKGIKTVAKINVIIFYLLLFLIILSLKPLTDGSLLNIMPVGGSGIINIFKGTLKSFQSYNGIEILLLIHPLARDSKSIKNAALKAVMIIAIVYTWIVFMTIYVLGIDLIPRSFWPSILVFHSIHIPLFNNFATIFMLLWSFILLKSIVNQYTVVTFILNDYIKVNVNKICLFLWPPVVYLTLVFSSEPKFSEYFNSLSIYILIFNIGYVTIIGLLISLNKKSS